jgi:branched-chain amino acid transport system permease protein
MMSRLAVAPVAGAAGLLALVALGVVPEMVPEYTVILVTQGLVYAIAAMSLDVLIGYTGLASLGHVAFFAIGAYATAISVTQHQASFAVALVLSVLAGTLASAVLAPLALRAAGIYFLMITLAIAMCVWGLAFRWVAVTGGDNGITGIPRPDVGAPWDMGSAGNFYYLILLVFLLCFAALLLLIRSPFGTTLVGIRDSESRMRVLGYNVWLHKYLAMIIAGAFAGLAGSLYAYFNSFVSPNDANLGHAMELVLMVSLGGPGTLVGAGLGALIIVFLKNMVSVYTTRWLMVLAAVYVASALYAPDGLMGLLRRLSQRVPGSAK